MIPVVKHQNYSIGMDPLTDKVWLLFNTTYENQPESVCVELPTAPWDIYKKYGDKEFAGWVKRIDEDYQVGRFSKDNPRIYTDYQLATNNEIESIIDCFKNTTTLIEQEALRLLFSLSTTYSNLAISCISEIIAHGKSIPIEIFCLMFRFYEREKPLIDSQQTTLIARAHSSEALTRLGNSSVAGCPDAAPIVLGLLTRINDPYKAFFQLAHLYKLKDEFNFRYLHERLNFYIEQVEKLKEDENDMPHMENLVHQFRHEFPAHLYFNTIKEREYIPNWLFMEQALSWERDCHKCLEECLLAFGIKLAYDDVQNLLHLPSGTDWRWHSYSVGQEIKYCPVDPAGFTTDTVRKPKFPVNSDKQFVIGVWRHYLNFLRPDLTISTDDLEKILENFIQQWNGE